MTPKTIQIYLPGGEPTGIRIAEITTHIVQVIDVPRIRLDDFLKMTESSQVAVYFLVRDTQEAAEPKLYIGQTGDLRTRLGDHRRDKEFWTRVLVLISKTNSLTQTHSLFLEWYCLQISETGRTLLATLGHPFFDPVAPSQAEKSQMETFYCKTSKTDAQGLFTPEGFVVLKGSRGIQKDAHSKEHSVILLLKRLVESGAMQVNGEEVVFIKDHLFGSPSAAATAVVGRSSNGWITWKTAEGKSLDEVKRKNPLS